MAPFSAKDKFSSAISQGPQAGGDAASSSSSMSWAWGYLVFICLSTAFRSFETGIISSMMPEITASLGLTYTDEGLVGASPDYGMIPGALLAGFVFKRCRAHYVLTAGYAMISAVCFLNAFHGSFFTLVLARAVGSFFWAFAVTHYPAWINTHGKESNRTIMLALPPVMLLLGLIGGYFVGGLAASENFATWTLLYGMEGALMGACALCSCMFNVDLVSNIDSPRPMAAVANQTASASSSSESTAGASQSTSDAAPAGGESPQSRDSSTAPAGERSPLPAMAASSRLPWPLGPLLSRFSLPEEVVALLSSRLFIFTVGVMSTMSGAGGITLPFIMQVGMAATGWDQHKFHLVSGAVMATAPLSGTIVGAVILQRLGGYQNFRRAFILTTCSGLLNFVGAIIVMISCAVTTVGPWSYVFIVGFFGLTFFSACPAAACNGVIISVVPGTAHYASGMSFAALHLFKLIVPMVGGSIIDRVGLLTGFTACLLGLGLMMLVCSGLAYREAKKLHAATDLCKDASLKMV